MSRILVARTAGTVIVKLEGLGTLHLAPGLSAFLDAQLNAGFRRFAFDLESCRGMDSTFVGLLVYLAQRVSKKPQDEATFPATEEQESEPPGAVVVTNANATCVTQMTMLGADRFVPLGGPVKIPELEMQELPDETVPMAERMELIKKAHQALTAIDQHNRERFGTVLEEIDQELEKRGRR